MIKDAIINEIVADFTQKRNRAMFLADKNREKAYKIQMFAELDLKARELNFEIGQAKFNKVNIIPLEQQLKFVKTQQEDVLNSYNMSLKDLEPAYECTICNDSGVYKNEYCSCFKQALSNKLMEGANVNLNEIPFLKNYDLSVFAKKDQEQIGKMIPILKEYVTDFAINKKKNWLFIGGTGSGKTYLAKCIAKEFIAKNYTTLFINSFNLNKKFLNEYLATENTKSTVLEDLIDLDLLIIDDLGAEPIKNKITKEYLLILLNERLARNKATIVTTNLRPDEIEERYGERISSRLINKESCVTCSFPSSDLRTKKQ